MKIDYDILCPIPWISSSTKPDGSIAVCCLNTYNDNLKRNDGSIYTTYECGLNDIRNDVILKEIRRQMINGEAPVSCRCYQLEKFKIRSRRIAYSEKYPKFIEYVKNTKSSGEIDVTKIPINIFDLRMSNHCNLECFMCNKKNSSRKTEMTNWAKEKNRYIPDLIENSEDIKEIYFTGGEPTLINEHWDLLKILCKKGHSKNIDLRYNTNGTFMKQYMFEIWKNFKTVQVSFSIDAIGKEAGIVRKNSNWIKIEKNLDYFDKNAPENVTSILVCTVSLLNLFSMPITVKWFLEKKFKKIDYIFCNILLYPEELSIKSRHYLIEPFKNQYKELYNDKNKWVRQIYEIIFKAISE